VLCCPSLRRSTSHRVGVGPGLYRYETTKKQATLSTLSRLMSVSPEERVPIAPAIVDVGCTGGRRHTQAS